MPEAEHKTSLASVIINLFSFAIAIWTAWYLYIHRDDLLRMLVPPKPCSKPIQYSIGVLDPRFNLSTSTVMERLATASGLWSNAIQKPLFQYDPNGALKVNFIYDDRQTATNQLKDLGYKISNDQSSYDELKAKYDSLKKTLASIKTALDADTSKYEQASSAYEAEVNSWNQKGGATKEVYARLIQTQAVLKQQSEALQKRIDAFNAQTKELNSLISVINRIADALNIKADAANQISQGRDKEFEEGEYRVENGKTEINIYEFDSQERLTRVLAHEFGHALGLEHVEDKTAVMYYLNQEKTVSLSTTDIQALDSLCKITK